MSSAQPNNNNNNNSSDPFDTKDTKQIIELMNKSIETLEQAHQLTKLINPKNDVKVSIESILGILRILIRDQEKIIQTLMVLMIERNNNSKVFWGIATDLEKLTNQVDKLWSAVNR